MIFVPNGDEAADLPGQCSDDINVIDRSSRIPSLEPMHNATGTDLLFASRPRA
jgi:hypothetical protein